MSPQISPKISHPTTGSVWPGTLLVISTTLILALLSLYLLRKRASPPSAAPAAVVATVKTSVAAEAAQSAAASRYHKEIKPILEEFCFDCHGDGRKKGNMSLDEFKDDGDLLDHKTQWFAVLKNVRAGVMPPPGKPQPNDAQQKKLADWIKYGAFGIDPSDPDPGRVTIHRLNRVEYRNTLAQILGVDYNTDDEFPPDAAGLGLDNIADLLSMSPLVLEKYLKAAEVSLDGAWPAEKNREFVVPGSAIRGNNNSTGDRLPFAGLTEVVYAFRNQAPGSFHVVFEMEVTGEGAATNKCHLVASEQSGLGPREILLERDFTGEPQKIQFPIDRAWGVEPHVFRFTMGVPVPRGFGRTPAQGPPAGPILKITNLRITAQPTAEARRFFSRENPPAAPKELREYIRQGVAEFGLRAFRRPIDDRTLNLLTDEIEKRYQQTGVFTESIKPSLVKILCSPRFLFRVTQTVPAKPAEPWSLIDEYSLASRLSYFLWSSMPDDELLQLAAAGKLRQNLGSQVKRMLGHKFAGRMIENFSGQWLQTRNVMKWTIVEPEVLKREGKAAAKPMLTDNVRQAMKDETTLFFGRIVRENRSLLEIIDSDYTYLNETLAGYYGMTNLTVTGPEMQLVTLPKESPRGGVMTQGSMLLVTSGANRTSAVKRGVFVLDNILGLRPHDPPPDIPSLDQASAKIKDHEPTFREALELHRQDPLCASCHKLMDPIGFGLDNFNAMGLYRETEFGQPIDASGQLASGEKFTGARELKQILKTSRRKDFYRCITEKLMTYALGRGLEYYDAESVDRIVDRLEKEKGGFSALLMGILESAPFQKRRQESAREMVAASGTASPASSDSRPLENKKVL